MNQDGFQVLAGGFTPASPTLTLTRPGNVTAYTAQDEVATSGTAPTTVSVGRFNGGSGIIQGATLVYSSNPSTTPQFRALIFSSTVTLAGDNAALSLSDADAAKCIGFIDFGTSQAGGSATSANLIAIGQPTCPIHFVCGNSEQTLYVALITLNGFTPIANGETITITLQVEQN